MKGWRFPVRKLISLVLLLACFLIANWVCRYQEVFRSSDQVGVVKAAEDDLSELSTPRLFMAGWPQKFYIKVEYDDLPGYAQFSWKSLAINLLVWSIAITCFTLYESRLHRLWKESGSGNKRRLTIVDLLVCTGLVAGAIAYWRALEQASAAESALAVEIAAAGGSTVQTVSLPQTALKILPDSLRTQVKRVSEVTLASPSSELLAKVIALPYLTKLSVGGGDYDLKLLGQLAQKPLLSVLRVSGRRLDPQAIAALATIKQLQSLNLMRTNITAKALEPLSDLPRLQMLNLIHTDIVLAEIGTPGWSKTVRALSLPHPAAGRGDHLKLEGWPELRTLTCNEYDERLNAQPVVLELKQMPRLRKVSLDALQSFDLQLDQLPELSELVPLHSQWVTRVLPAETVPKNLAIRKLSLGSLPGLRSLQLYAQAVDEMRFREPLTMRLELANLPVEGSTPTRFTEVEELIDSGKQAWVDGWSEKGGPSELSFVGLALNKLNFSQLAKCEGIRSLNLDQCSLGHEQLRQLGDMKGLEELFVEGCAVSGETVAWLAANLPGLRKLHCNPLTLGRLKLENHPQLEQLFGSSDYPVIPIDALRLAGMTNLKDAFDLPRELRYLQVENAPSLTGLSTRGPWPDKAIFQGVRDLTYFAAGGPRLDDSVAEAVLACEKLEALTLAHSSVSPAMLAKIGTLKNLSYLALSGSKVDDEVVAQWQALTSLRTLRLDDTAITDKAIAFIARCGNLQRLSLSDTQVTADGLARLSGLKELVRIDYGGADVSVEKLKAICAIPSLSTLDLSDSTVNAKALAVLQESSPGSLRLLILKNSQIDSQALVQLARVNSGLEFDLTDADVNPDVLATLGTAERVTAPTSEEEDTQSLLSAYMMNSFMKSQGIASLPGAETSGPKPGKGQVEPRLFAPDALAAGSNSPLQPDPGFSWTEPPFNSSSPATPPMSIPALIGYAIGNISQAVSEFTTQGENHVEQY